MTQKTKDTQITPVVDESVVDAVFVIGTGSKNNNEELKYALRNLDKNCPFVRDVYISGECPDWVDTSVVKHLPWPDRFKHAKDANIIDKLRHACEQPGIAKRILFCSDDQFQTRPCTWEDFSPRWLRRYNESDSWYADRKRLWHTRLRNTLERDRLRRVEQNLNSEDVFYYQPHIWMPIDRDLFIDYAKWSDYEHREDTIIASGYFNYIDAGGKSNYDHVFISSNQEWPVKATHIAYSDPSFMAAMSYLKKTFDTPSRFEISSVGTTEKTQKKEGVRSDDEIINDLKNKVQAEAVWKPLQREIEEAEALRHANVSGWKKVWNDIIRRWVETTDKGKLLIPIVSEKSNEAKDIIELYRSKTRVEPKKAEPEGSSRKPCTKCEERKRRAREERERQEREALEKTRSAVAGSVNNEMLTEDTIESSDACLDCAIDHLSVSVAHMNSNLSRPTMLDIELAKGEVMVAAQHLLALHHNEEYNMCIRAVDSIYSVNSLFSVSSLREILRKVIERKSK